MFNVNEQFNQFTLGNLEASLRMAQLTLDSAEKLVKFQLETSKQALEENAKAARELGTATNPQEALTRLNKLTTQSIEQAVNNSRGLYDIVSQTQNAFSKLAEENVNVINKSLISSVETLAKNAPAGSDAMLNAIKSSVSASTTALSNITRAAQQVAEFAETNIKTATKATVDAVKAGNKAAA